MARNYSDDERAAILARSYELLSRDVTDTRQVSEPEMSREELREVLAQPTERRNTRIRREYDEEKAQKMETMAQLEARLNAKIAAERDATYRAVAEVFAKFCEPYEARLAELQDRIDNMRGRDGVSVTACAINHKGELLLTLSDGTQLCPGRVVAKAGGRVEPDDVIDLPKFFEARRQQ